VVVLIVEELAVLAIHNPSTKDPLLSDAVLIVTEVGSVRMIRASVTAA
jgi:hypothetical protein